MSTASRAASRIAIWTQGGDEFMRATSQDAVRGVDGQEHVSDQATIWRWREAYQNDFAARMDWTVKDFAHANHNPLLVVNGKPGTGPVELEAAAGQTDRARRCWQQRPRWAEAALQMVGVCGGGPQRSPGR